MVEDDDEHRKDLECEILEYDGGYQAMCPSCPWTSGIRKLESSAKILYSKHLDHILGKGPNG